MELIFAGSGSAFTVGCHNYHSNMLLKDDQDNYLLIDCGSDIRHSLNLLDLGHSDIDCIYISHLHADHVGGMEWLALNRFFDPACGKPTLFICERLSDEIWQCSLSGGLKTIREIDAKLADFFNVQSVPHQGNFSWGGIEFTLVPTLHVENNYKPNPCNGLFFTINNKNIWVTADTKFTPQDLKAYYEKADIIFHDCETNQKKSGVHATFEELITLDPAIKRKMWLYHYNPKFLPDAKKEGFQGFVERGQVFKL